MPAEVVYPILIVQVLTFVLLGVVFMVGGEFRLGVAQLLLAAVQGVIYAP
jgi:hypothetical protein